MTAHDVAWMLGRPVLGGSAAAATRLHSYGGDRIPRTGGLVMAFNHFHWIDIPCFGWVCKRHLYYLAKVEAHRVPGLWRSDPQGFSARSSVRRGESDRRGGAEDARGRARGRGALGVFVGIGGLGSGAANTWTRAQQKRALRWSRCRRTCL